MANDERVTLDFFDLARVELERARRKFPRRQTSLHEGYAVLLEEVDEIWDAIKSDRVSEDPHHLLVECIQVAAMAARMAEDRGLLAALDMPSAGGSGDLLLALQAIEDDERVRGQWSDAE